MPTYRNGDSIKVTAPKEFTDQVRAKQDEFIVDAKLANMKFNLPSSEARMMFEQWNQMKREADQRLQRAQQLSSQREQKDKERQHQQQLRRYHQQQQLQQKPPIEPNNSSNIVDNKEVVRRNLEFIRKVVNGSN